MRRPTPRPAVPNGRRRPIEAGRFAFAQHRWAEAHQQLSDAGADAPLGPEDLERLAIAAHLAGDDDGCVEAWSKAHHAHLDRGAPADATRCAFWVGLGLVLRGQMAPGGGWLARARRLVEDHGLDGVECGYLLLPDALMASGAGDHAAGLTGFEEAGAIARRFADADLTALAAIGRGQCLLRMGRAADGVGLFDEAMVSVTAGETSPVVSGIVYCAVIDECQQAFDVRRAQEWTDALSRWCEAQPEMVPYRGQCLVHRAQLLQLHGAWQDAMAEARRARERLADPPHPAVGMADYQLGELHRLRGDVHEAEAAYRRALDRGRDPQPGLACLRLAQGRVEDAARAIDRALEGAGDLVDRVQLLPSYVDIMVAAGQPDDAAGAAEELAGHAARTGAAPLHAAAAACLAAVRLHDRPRAALDAARDACRRWRALEAPYHEAESRLLFARACWALGDRDTALLERDAARATFTALGAAPALARLDALLGDPATSGRVAEVSPRELDVLRLVARGMTNREIAEALVISEKTVERHLANVFTRLGVANRAAATAYAYDHHLL